jgi:chromate transporter
LPQVAGLLYGVKPVVIAIVAQALWNLGRSAIKSPLLAVLAIAAVVAAAVGVNELLVLAASGLLAALVDRGKVARRGAVAAVLGGVSWPRSLAAASAATGSTAVAVWPLFAVFAKAGAVLFGSGYVLLAFLRADLVDRLGWLTEAQLLDAVAVGQVTPGPVFTTATFIGYVLAGPIGAVVATVGIFLPAFVFVALSGPVVPRLRRSRTAGAVLDGVNVASLALMAVVSWQLGRAALIDPLTIMLAVTSAVALLYARINPAWLIAAAAMVGWLRS